MRYDLPDIPRRLDMLLRDRGYVYARGVDYTDRAKAYRVISCRVLRCMTESRWTNLCKGEGLPMTAEEAVMVADGLGFDVRKLLYEEGSIPRKPERPANLFDELDAIGGVVD